MPTYIFQCPVCYFRVETSTREPPPCQRGAKVGIPTLMRRVWSAPNLSASARGVELPNHHGGQG